jgi:hypothetical protein
MTTEILLLIEVRWRNNLGSEGTLIDMVRPEYLRDFAVIAVLGLGIFWGGVGWFVGVVGFVVL